MISMSLSRAANAINASYQGNDVVFSGCSTDTRTIARDNLFIAIQGEKFDGHDFVSIAEEKGAASLMLQHEVKHSLPSLMVEDTRKAMGLLAKSWREEMAIPLVAITGSNGKTTVKEMVNTILSQVADVHATTGNLNNDIGVPLTLFGLDKKHRYAVIEMGANHPGEIEWLSSISRPNVAVITQCAPAHLEGFGSVEGVAKAKAEIFSGLQSNGTAIINADDPFAEYWQTVCEHKNQCTFGITAKNVDVSASNIEIVSEQSATHFNLKTDQGLIEIRLNLLGQHNVMNALAAAACCLKLDISLSSIKSGLEKVKPVKGRLQVKQGKFGSRIIDDTYNANPTSYAAALNVLRSYSGRRYMVLGDMGELGETAKQLHADAGKDAKYAGVDGLFTIGDLSINAMESFGEGAFHYDSYDALNRALLEILGQKTTVLIKGSRSMHMERIVEALTEEQ